MSKTIEVLIYIFITYMGVVIVFMVTSFVYSIITMYKQSKEFINRLKIGDKTNFGTVSELDGDYVIINRKPLRIHRKDIQPETFKANKYLFLFK